MLESLYQTHADPAVALALQATCEAQVTSWRWATESMGFVTPEPRESSRWPRPRWVAESKVDVRKHVQHGLDVQGRIVFERGPSGRIGVWLHQQDCRHYLTFHGGGHISDVWEFREEGGRLQALDLVRGGCGIDRTYHWEGDRLLCEVMRNWSTSEPTWWCQNVFSYNDAGQLDRVVLEYPDNNGCATGPRRLQYQRPRPGETLATVTAEVEQRLVEDITAQLSRIPRDEPLYCLLLCFTDCDFTSAWPPFLVWGRQSYREAVMAQGEDVAYFLWAPDEMRGMQGNADESWFDNEALVEACKRHSQFMALRSSYASAKRVLKRVAAWLDAPEHRALLNTTDDFVVAVADNTGNVDPLPGMRRAIGPERWARLKERGYV